MVVNVVARVPAGGHCAPGKGVSVTGQRSGLKDLVNACVLGDCVTSLQGHFFALTSFLSLFCHSVPSCYNKASKKSSLVWLETLQ